MGSKKAIHKPVKAFKGPKKPAIKQSFAAPKAGTIGNLAKMVQAKGGRR